jgi:hypothetical protein
MSTGGENAPVSPRGGSTGAHGRNAQRQRVVAFSWLLGGLLVTYALVITTGERLLGSFARTVALALVLLAALRIRRLSRGRTGAIAVVSAAAVVVAALATAFARGTVLTVLTASTTLALVTVTSSLVIRYLMVRARVDLATVLGVLCIYLLIAMLFSSLHEIGGALVAPYLGGTSAPPSPGDCLYYSVITITTVGIGDIGPVSNLARMVTVLEAVVGQLYLVSVVAAVVSGWRPGVHRGAA